MDFGSFKDFEQVRLKATYNMKIGDREFQEGETLAYFDKIQIAGFDEVVSRISANGGFGNRAHVFWETTKQINLNFRQGVFSPIQWALLVNSKVLCAEESAAIPVSFREQLESNEQGIVLCKFKPSSDVYVYSKQTGTKLPFTINEEKIDIGEPYVDVVVDYTFLYEDGAKIFEVGQKLLNGYLSLEGITRIKDDESGHTVTGIIKVPRIKLVSNLSIRLGQQAAPVAANFSAVGIPVGSRGESMVCEFSILNSDIQSDL